MIGAELTKLLRRPSNVAILATFLALIPAVVVGIVQIVSASGGAGHGPVGDPANAQAILFTVGMLTAIAGVTVGARAGTQDLAAGVFRGLVSTGVSRRRLWAVRVPAALVVSIGAAACAAAIVIGAAEVTRVDGADPFGSRGHLLQAFLVILAYAVAYTLLGLGVGALAGSTGAAVVALFSYLFVLGPLVGAVGFASPTLHPLVYLHLYDDVNRWWPWATEQDRSAGAVPAVLALVATVLGTMALGAWRTLSREA